MSADLEHVPTVVELALQGQARPVEYTDKGTATRWRISAEGQALIYDAMARNAATLRVRDSARFSVAIALEPPRTTVHIPPNQEEKKFPNG